MPKSGRRRTQGREQLAIGDLFRGFSEGFVDIVMTDMPGSAALMQPLLVRNAKATGCEIVLLRPEAISGGYEHFLRGVIEAAGMRSKPGASEKELMALIGAVLRGKPIVILLGADAMDERMLSALVDVSESPIWMLASDPNALERALQKSDIPMAIASLQLTDRERVSIVEYVPSPRPIVHSGVALLRTRAKADLDQIMADGVCAMLLGKRLGDTIVLIQPEHHEALNMRLIALGHTPALERV